MTFNWKNILISAVYISTDFIGMSSSLKLQSTSLIKLAIRQDSGNISDVLNSIPLQVCLEPFLLYESRTHQSIQCQETCNTLLTTLTVSIRWGSNDFLPSLTGDQECQSPNCICTNETGQKLESCLECIISVAPIQGQIDKGQELLNSMSPFTCTLLSPSILCLK